MALPGIAPEGLLQLQTTEVQSAGIGPGDHATVEDRARQPAIVEAKRAKRHFDDAVEEAAIHRHHRSCWLRELGQELESCLSVGLGEWLEPQADRWQVATCAHQLQGFDSHLEHAAFDHKTAAQPGCNSRTVEGLGRCFRRGARIDSVKHQPPRLGKAQTLQPCGLIRQHHAMAPQLWAKPQPLKGATLRRVEVETEIQVIAEALN